MGRSETPRLFVRVFMRAIGDWGAAEAEHTKALRLRMPLGLPGVQVAEVSLSIFADDIIKRHFVRGGLATDGKERIDSSAAALNEELGTDGFKQNMDKREFAPRLRRPVQQRRFFDLVQPTEGKALPWARYLGGRHSFNNCNGVEVLLRVRAMQAGWASVGDFWTSQASWSIRRLVLSGVVWMAGLSGMETYFLLNRELDKPDTEVVKKLRVMMRGAGCEKKHDGERAVYAAQDNRAIFKYWKLLPARGELMSRRLKWLQAMVDKPFAFVHVIAALFGGFRYIEEECTLDERGHLLPSAPPFLLYLQADMDALRGTSGTEDFFEEWDRHDCS